MLDYFNSLSYIHITYYLGSLRTKGFITLSMAVPNPNRKSVVIFDMSLAENRK